MSELLGGCYKNEAIAIHLYPEVINYVYKNKLPDFLISEGTQRTTELQSLDKATLLKPYMASLIFYFENPAIVDEEVIVLKIKELLNLLYKINSNDMQTFLQDMFTPTELHFKGIVQKNIYQDLSVEELAHLCNMSLSSFKRKFKTLFNDSPASYIKNKRLEKAAELLKISNNRIVEICLECGFSNPDAFSKSFKSKFNKTPRDYKKSFGPN